MQKKSIDFFSSRIMNLNKKKEPSQQSMGLTIGKKIEFIIIFAAAANHNHSFFSQLSFAIIHSFSL